MQAAKTLLKLGVVSALVATLLPATVQAASFARTLAQLSDTDREAIVRARNEVLDKMMPGAVSAWKDEKAGHSGEARLLRIYQQKGTSCAEVEHVLKLPAVSRYVRPFCRANDGSWREAS